MNRLWTLLVVVALFASGCASESGSTGDGAASAGFRAHRSGSGGGNDAIVAGIVETDDEAGCIWLSDPDGARYPVVWPAGTLAQSDPTLIILRDGQVVEPGDRVEGGGGYVPAGQAMNGMGLEPFASECVHAGDAAVFNSDSPIAVTEGVGLEVAETLVSRFSPPEPIGLELIAVDAGARSVAIIDFVNGTVHRYQPDQYVAPPDAIDGVSGGGGFIHIWAAGTIHTYWPLDREPLVYRPEPSRDMPGVASTLEVLSAPDGDHTWLVQAGVDAHPTLVELVNVVEFRLARLAATETEGSWQPVGATVEGLILVSDTPEPTTRLVSQDGMSITEVPGTALSVGWNGAAVVRPDGSLVVTDGRLGDPLEVDKPGDGSWMSVGESEATSTSPPVSTGADQFLVMLAEDPDEGALSAGDLVVVDRSGLARSIHRLSQGPHLASWSRGFDWVVVVKGSSVTLVSLEDGSTAALGDLIPDSHHVLTAG